MVLKLVEKQIGQKSFVNLMFNVLESDRVNGQNANFDIRSAIISTIAPCLPKVTSQDFDYKKSLCLLSRLS